MKRVVSAVVMAVALGVTASASAHVERPSYWPDPAADTSITPAAGGIVPRERNLFAALRKALPGDTRVVCQGAVPKPKRMKRATRRLRRARAGGASRARVKQLTRRRAVARRRYRRAVRRNPSIRELKRSVARARREGYKFRPSEPSRTLTKRQAKRLLQFNVRLLSRCKYHEIQPAVTASHNNDRVVVLPGLYTEPTARKAPTHDPACDKYRTNGDKPGEEGTALSYAYQANCPNDQNLIAVIGREVGAQAPPMPPRENRHGIPDLGRCIRCNLQLEGSGVTADDVIVEAGDASKGDGGPNGVGTVKDVAVRADRADGFVLKNVKVRHAKEHGIYVLEADGYLLTRFKAYYNGLYGTLTFVEDHGVQEHCDAVGHGDSGIYPGAAVETGAQRPAGTEFRYNQEIRYCDLHHNMAGYSGTNGNAVYVHHNKVYDNALGLQTDVVTGAGHPGYPGDSMLVEDNWFYSNNFNVYEADSSVKPAFPFPVGTGLWIAGGNRHQIRKNYFYDNWRRGTMLFSVPDQLVCGPSAGGNQQAGCNPNGQTTSFFNSQYENHMGVRPDGKADPNGTDFWWDPYPGTVGNCWWSNIPAAGAQITSSPGPLPDCDNGANPEKSVGTGNPAQTGELASCVAAFETRTFDPNGPCPWFKTPPEPQPGGGANASQSAGSAFDWPAATVQRRYEGPLERRSDLSGVQCADWNSASDEDRAWLVAAVAEFAGGVVVDSQDAVGYGDVLTTEQANGLFNTQCRNSYAQGFVLYKLYTYAAALTE